MKDGGVAEDRECDSLGHGPGQQQHFEVPQHQSSNPVHKHRGEHCPLGRHAEGSRRSSVCACYVFVCVRAFICCPLHTNVLVIVDVYLGVCVSYVYELELNE